MKRTILIEEDLIPILKERVRHQTLSNFINQCIREHFEREKEQVSKETSVEVFSKNEFLDIW